MLNTSCGARRALPLLMSAIIFCLLSPVITGQDDQPPTPPEVMRLGRGVMRALAWHPAGEALAVASTAGAWLLDADFSVTARLAQREMQAVAWSPDGERLALSSAQADHCRLAVRDIQADARLWGHDLCADGLAWSPDGERLAAIHRGERRVTLADADGSAPLSVPGASAVWSPDGTRLALGGAGGLFIWDAAASRTELARVVPGYGDVVAWDDEAITLLCHEADATRNVSGLCRIDPTSGDLLANETFIYRHPGEISQMLAFAWDSGRFSFALTNQPAGELPFLHVYDWSGTDRRSFITAGSMAAWLPGAAVVTVAGENGVLRRFDATSGTTLHEATPFTAPVTSLAWSPDGARLAAGAAGLAGYLRLWDAEADPLQPAQVIEPGMPARQVRWSGDTLIASGQVVQDDLVTAGLGAWSDAGVSISGAVTPLAETPVIAWNSDLTRQAISQAGTDTVTLDDVTLTTGAPVVRALAWSPDDGRIATLSAAATDPDTAVLEVWEAASGGRISTAVLPGVRELHPAIFWSRTGDLLHITARTTAYEAFAIYAFDSATGLTRFQYGTPQFYPPATAYSPDDVTLAIETLTAIVFVDTQTGRPFRDQIPAGFINGLAWHPGGDWLAGAGGDGIIRIWDVSALHPAD